MRVPKKGDKVVVFSPGKEAYGIYRGYGEAIGKDCITLEVVGRNYNAVQLIPVEQITGIDYLSDNVWEHHLVRAEQSQHEWQKQYDVDTYSGDLHIVGADFLSKIGNDRPN